MEKLSGIFGFGPMSLRYSWKHQKEESKSVLELKMKIERKYDHQGRRNILEPGKYFNDNIKKKCS